MIKSRSLSERYGLFQGQRICSMVVTVLCIGLSSQVWADSVPVAKRRDSHMVIQANGEIQVEEVWVMEFPKREKPFHTGYRMIPFRRLTDVTHWEMEEEGHRYREVKKNSEEQPYTFYEEANKEGKKYTWFFPPTEKATRTFRIRYRLEGALRIDPLGDQLFYESIEADRAYVVQAASVEVSFPSPLKKDPLNLKHYLNGKEQSLGVILDANTVLFRTGAIDAGSHWAIKIQFPHGIVHTDSPLWQSQEQTWAWVNLLSLIFAPIILIGGSLGLFILWYKRGRDNPILFSPGMVTQPPDKKPPGLVGVLVEERVKFRHILATIIDLARRGYLEIQESPNPSGGGTASRSDFILVRKENQNEAGLIGYEKMILGFLFLFETTKKLSELKYQFARVLPEIRNELSKQTERDGDFIKAPESIGTKYLLLGMMLLFLSLGAFGVANISFSKQAPATLLVAGAMAIVSLLLMGLSAIMPKHTAQGTLAAMKWGAFLKYLKELKQYQNSELAQDIFERFLPYAIACGFEKHFTQIFLGSTVPVPSWYIPWQMASSSLFNSNPQSAMNSNVSNRGSSISMDSISSQFFSMLDSASSVLSSSKGGSGGGGTGGSSSGGGSSGFN